jgi:hypothetical protein
MDILHDLIAWTTSWANTRYGGLALFDGQRGISVHEFRLPRYFLTPECEPIGLAWLGQPFSPYVTSPPICSIAASFRNLDIVTGNDTGASQKNAT